MERIGIYLALGILYTGGLVQVYAAGDALTSCEFTAMAYNRLQPRDGAEVPSTPQDGTTLKTCQATSTCCTRRMEQQLSDKASHDFNSALQDAIAYLEYSIGSSAVDFHGEFNELLRYGEERIKQYFGTMYPNIAGSLEDDIQVLFETLRDHLRGRPANVPVAVDNFFNELFALLYNDQINARNSRLDGFNLRCIAGQQRTIRPFGDFPLEIRSRLYKSIELARLLLTSLNLGVEVLNSTHHMQLGKKCSKGLLEMQYCATCQGLTTVKPCNSYCINVMKGCLANFVDIDGRWNEYVTSVINLVRMSMVVDYDLQLAVHSLDAKIIDAIGIAKDDATRIISEVSTLCRTPSRGRPSPQARDFAVQQPSLSIPMAPNPSVPLDERLVTFVQSLDSSRMLYRSLSRGLCTKGILAAARTDDACWNGQDVGSYNEPIVEDGLAAQNNNPEVNWSGRELELLQAMSLMDKLEHVVTAQRSWSKNNGANDIVSDDFSGSGSGEGCSGDDSDECEGSGEPILTMTTMEPDSGEDSGEAKTTPDADFTFEPSRQSGLDNNGIPTKATRGKGSSNVGEEQEGGASSTISNIFLTVCMLLSWRLVL